VTTRLDHVAGAYGAGVTLTALAGPKNVGPLVELCLDNTSDPTVRFGPSSAMRIAAALIAWAHGEGAELPALPTVGRAREITAFIAGIDKCREIKEAYGTWPTLAGRLELAEDFVQ